WRLNSATLTPRSAACSRDTAVHMSVSTKPGHTQLTRMPSPAWARARLFVMLTTAALLALYARLVRLPTLAAIEARLTMQPRFRAIIAGNTAWLAKKTALALMSITASQWASVTSRDAAAR